MNASQKRPSTIAESLNKARREEIGDSRDAKYGVLGGKVVRNTIRPRTYAEILKSGKKY